MKNDKAKTAIFGGSFDPPHFGHIDIVKNLEKRFDKVIVVPSYISPFKQGENSATARYSLCKKVFSSQKTEVSRYEIGKKGVSYSVDTAAYFKKRMDGDLYWVIGSEELTRLEQWHDIDRLKTLVTFYVVPRPNYTVKSDILKTLKKRKIKLKLAGFDGLDISSTRIKLDMAFGKQNAFMPSEVHAFAVKRGLFDPYGKYVEALYRYGLSGHRIGHIYRTAIYGAELAKLYGGSVNDAVTACLLHDIAKATDPKEYADKCDLSGFPNGTEHAAIGAYIAKHEFGVSDEVEHAIYVHSLGDAEMSLLDEIVYLADKAEAGRRYDSLEYVRYLCSVDKDLAMLYALTEINGLERSEKNPFAERAIEFYKNKCGNAEFPPMSEREHKPAPKAKATPSEKKVFVSTGDEIRDIAVAAAAELSLRKGRNVDIVALNGKTIVADYFVIASVTSATAVKALMGYVEDRLKKQFDIDPNKRDINAEWIALDYGGVIIHIFTEKTREFYNIERLWSDGGNIERYEG